MALSEKKIGHIRIERQLGRGGMGEIYLGFDETLERRVALKVLREDRRLSANATARFRGEARLLSRLDHPNICRIYDCIEGKEADFLVLELIDGRGLGKRIREGLDPQEKLGIAIQINDALVEAHAAGIVHRDLKPSNVMITRDGQVKVLDFGLARSADTMPPDGPDDAAEADTVTDGDVTRIPDSGAMRSAVAKTAAGTLIGTLGFMSPEQARGRPATTASDMYSFGLLLQTLFTRGLPYEPGLDQSRLLEQARNGQTLPITGIDSDVAKLIGRLESLAPASRPTAVEVAERLRWIHDRRRRRIRNVLVAAAVVIAALAGTKYALDLRRGRDEAQLHRAQADALIGFMLGDLREKLEPLGRLDILDDVGDKALEHFESLAVEGLTGDELFQHAEALQQIGEVRIAQGDLKSALVAFEESLAQAEHLAAREPLKGEWQKGLGAAHFWVGYVHWERNDIAHAMRHFESYRSIAEQLVSREPDREEWRQELAYAHSNMASVLEEQGDLDGALAEYRATLAMKQALVESDRDDPKRQHALGLTHEDLGQLLQSLGRLDEAEQHLRHSVSIRRTLVDREPDDAERLRDLGVSLYFLGVLLEDRGDFESALEQFRADHEIAKSLAALDPENSTWQREVAVSRGQLGYVLARREPEEALRQLATARATLEDLVAKDGTNAAWERDLATIAAKTGLALEAQGRGDEALRTAGRAEQALEALHRKHPDDRRVRRWLSMAYLLEGRLLNEGNNPKEANQAWTRALTTIETFGQDANETWMLELWARALLQLDRLSEAEPLIRKLSERGYRSESFQALCEGKGMAL